LLAPTKTQRRRQTWANVIIPVDRAVKEPTAMSPCPYCGSAPTVERCDPWEERYGKAPWYVGCYRDGDREHFIGVNGETKDDALKNWERAVADHKTVR